MAGVIGRGIGWESCCLGYADRGQERKCWKFSAHILLPVIILGNSSLVAAFPDKKWCVLKLGILKASQTISFQSRFNFRHIHMCFPSTCIFRSSLPTTRQKSRQQIWEGMWWIFHHGHCGWRRGIYMYCVYIYIHYIIILKIYVYYI